MSELREMPVLLGAWHGEPETLLLIGAPDEHAHVALRRWDARNWSASPHSSLVSAGGLCANLESEISAGRSANQSAYAIREWLSRRTGTAPGGGERAAEHEQH